MTKVFKQDYSGYQTLVPNYEVGPMMESQFFAPRIQKRNDKIIVIFYNNDFRGGSCARTRAINNFGMLSANR